MLAPSLGAAVLLKASWHVVRVVGTSRLGNRGGLLAELINDAPHAGIIEHGARPHGVSREGWDAIYEWVRRHFGFTVMGARSQKMRGVMGETGEDPVLSEITWGIVKKLKREGQKPTYFIRNSLDECQELAAEEIERAIAEVARGKGDE